MAKDDLAGEAYWSEIYKLREIETSINWRPSDYNSLVLESIIRQGVTKSSAKSILEIGCGGSVWLPYLAKVTGASVSGIDYSTEGCLLAQHNLEANGVKGSIHCIDIFEADENNIGNFDLVFSLGVVEHFRDLNRVLLTMKKFVKPGGIILTEIPNLSSFHGILGWLYHPKIFNKHQIIKKNQLINAHNKAGFIEVEGNYKGLFSLNMVAYGINPRFPKIDKALMTYFRHLVTITDKLLVRTHYLKSSLPFFAPFIYVVGRRS